MNNNAISDTLMFFLGMSIGISFNYIFNEYVVKHATKRQHFFSIGIIQILANAMVIRFIRGRVKSIGLFTLGLLTSQSLVIKKCY